MLRHKCRISEGRTWITICVLSAEGTEEDGAPAAPKHVAARLIVKYMVYFKNSFRWSFFHHNWKMHGPSCKITLHVSGTFRTHHQEYNNCSWQSLAHHVLDWYSPFKNDIFLKRTIPKRSLPNVMLCCTNGCQLQLLYSWWWVRKVPETCRVEFTLFISHEGP
jgi:hypothetical protein